MRNHCRMVSVWRRTFGASPPASDGAWDKDHHHLRPCGDSLLGWSGEQCSNPTLCPVNRDHAPSIYVKAKPRLKAEYLRSQGPFIRAAPCQWKKARVRRHFGPEVLAGAYLPRVNHQPEAERQPLGPGCNLRRASTLRVSSRVIEPRADLASADRTSRPGAM